MILTPPKSHFLNLYDQIASTDSRESEYDHNPGSGKEKGEDLLYLKQMNEKEKETKGTQIEKIASMLDAWKILWGPACGGAHIVGTWWLGCHGLERINLVLLVLGGE